MRQFVTHHCVIPGVFFQTSVGPHFFLALPLLGTRRFPLPLDDPVVDEKRGVDFVVCFGFCVVVVVCVVVVGVVVCVVVVLGFVVVVVVGFVVVSTVVEVDAVVMVVDEVVDGVVVVVVDVFVVAFVVVVGFVVALVVLRLILILPSTAISEQP